jgi:hypothetical protein
MVNVCGVPARFVEFGVINARYAIQVLVVVPGVGNVKLTWRVGCGIVVELMPVIVNVPVPGTVGEAITTVH